MSATTRRRIFAELRRSGETLTTAELAARIDAHLPTVANMCSHMEIMGALDRPNGTRRGYRLIVRMLPEDVATVAELARTYGGDAMLDAVKIAAAEQLDAACERHAPCDCVWLCCSVHHPDECTCCRDAREREAADS